MILWELKASNQ